MLRSSASRSRIRHGVCISSSDMPGRAGTSYPTSRPTYLASMFMCWTFVCDGKQATGENMLKFYYSGAPNPTKVALFLEETGTPYEPIPIDTRKGEQHKAEFLAINPNAKLPAIVDGDVTVFDSSAILLYLAEKTGKFLPAKTDKARAELLSWMFFVSSGVGPYFGQSVHFRNYAPEKIPYAVNRYAFEAQRHAGILNARL